MTEEFLPGDIAFSMHWYRLASSIQDDHMLNALAAYLDCCIHNPFELHILAFTIGDIGGKDKT